jgi:hypothetical protein
MACLLGPSFHEGSGVLGADEGLAGEYDDQQGEGMAEELHIELLRLLEGRHCQPRTVAGLGVTSICRKLSNAALRCLLWRGDLDCSSANDLLWDCFALSGRV